MVYTAGYVVVGKFVISYRHNEFYPVIAAIMVIL
jgi:hypothetical protein